MQMVSVTQVFTVLKARLKEKKTVKSRVDAKLRVIVFRLQQQSKFVSERQQPWMLTIMLPANTLV